WRCQRGQPGSGGQVSPPAWNCLWEAEPDRSCCTRVRRIRASTHSLSKSSSSRISIWRVAVTDGCKGTSAFKKRTMGKKNLLGQDGIYTAPPSSEGSHHGKNPEGGSGFCCPKLCASPRHKPPPLLICQGHKSLSRPVFGNSCSSACF
ncbi:hypothetical protein CIB84_003816, partial [Bambusicola thoracicus]